MNTNAFICRTAQYAQALTIGVLCQRQTLQGLKTACVDGTCYPCDVTRQLHSDQIEFLAEAEALEVAEKLAGEQQPTDFRNVGTDWKGSPMQHKLTCCHYPNNLLVCRCSKHSQEEITNYIRARKRLAKVADCACFVECSACNKRIESRYMRADLCPKCKEESEWRTRWTFSESAENPHLWDGDE